MRNIPFFERPDIYGKYVSFLPLTETVLGITLDGFKYLLHNKDISILEDPSLCVSNEIPGERAKITFRKRDPDLRGVKRLKGKHRVKISSVKKQKKRDNIRCSLQLPGEENRLDCIKKQNWTFHTIHSRATMGIRTEKGFLMIHSEI